MSEPDYDEFFKTHPRRKKRSHSHHDELSHSAPTIPTDPLSDVLTSIEELVQPKRRKHSHLDHAESSRSATNSSSDPQSSRSPPSAPADPQSHVLASVDELVMKDTKRIRTKSNIPQDYDLTVMSTVVLNSDHDLPPDPFQSDSTSEKLVEFLLAEQAISGILPVGQGGAPSVSDTNTSTVSASRAIVLATRILEVLKEAQQSVSTLRSDSPNTETIQSVLLKAESSYAYGRDQIRSITQTTAGAQVREASGVLEDLQRSITLWRELYPDNSAIKIDNSHMFVDTKKGLHSSTLIAHSATMANRLFSRTSRRGGDALLKSYKLFGYHLTQLSGGPNRLQQEALNRIPESIPTLEDSFNLDVKSEPLAICPRCCFAYHPSYTAGSSKPSYPTHCTELSMDFTGVCGAELLNDRGNALKVLHYYPFEDWFGRFIALPGIEQYGDQFCEEVSEHQTHPPAVQSKASDGSFFHSFPGANGELFIADRKEEGRWFFLFHADFFNVEGNRLRGKTSSTGIMSITCLNLPLAMRNDSAYRYIPGLIQGPHEPDSKTAQHRHYLRPVITAIVKGYSRGFRPYNTGAGREHGSQPYQRVFRTAIAGAVMDTKAARPFLGLLDINSHHHCFTCQCFHRAHIGRIDFENWKNADPEFLRKGAELWRDASDAKKRALIEEFFGTRDSELLRILGWNPCLQMLLDAMHILYLVLHQRFFRDSRALGLDNPGSKAKKGGKKNNRNRKGKGRGKDTEERPPVEQTTEDLPELDAETSESLNRLASEAYDEKPLGHVAFYYDFVFPPHPCTLTPYGSLQKPPGSLSRRLEIVGLGADDQRLSILEWGDLSPILQDHRVSRAKQLRALIEADYKSFLAVGLLHRQLSAEAPSQDQRKQSLERTLRSHKWAVLAYVCNDLHQLPGEQDEVFMQSTLKKSSCTKKQMVHQLIHWRNTEVAADQFTWPYFKCTTAKTPSIPWADLHDAHESAQCINRLRTISAEDRQEMLAELKSQIDHRSAVDIGSIHRYLTQPVVDVNDKPIGNLGESLLQMHLDALAFVCIDLNRLPSGKFGKAELVDSLIVWRMAQPLKSIPRIAINASETLDRVQLAVREVTLPSWIARPPPNVGTKRAGTLKADHWRVLFGIHVPLAFVTLWSAESPTAASNAAEMTPALDTSMHLTCASLIVSKNTLTAQRRDHYRTCIRNHIIGLKQNFPGFILPSHHLAFHIYDSMESFSTARNWWAFPFENLIGKLQRIPTNHKPGELEKTIAQSFYKGASFRQWLLRPDCPKGLHTFRDILEKAYGYAKSSTSGDATDVDVGEDDVAERDGDANAHDNGDTDQAAQTDDKLDRLAKGTSNTSDKLLSKPPSSDLIQAAGTRDLRCYSQIPAPRGFYNTPSALAVGNSFICYRPDGDPKAEWVAGQIHHIFQLKGRKKLGVLRSKLVHRESGDPFSRFWSWGFEAKVMSSVFTDRLEVVELDWVVGHTARWEFFPGLVAVLNLGRE